MQFFDNFCVTTVDNLVFLSTLSIAKREGSYFSTSPFTLCLASFFTCPSRARVLCLKVSTGLLCLLLGKLQVGLSSGFQLAGTKYINTENLKSKLNVIWCQILSQDNELSEILLNDFRDTITP